MSTEQVKKKFKFPTAFTILVLITVVVAILTFVIPAGRYDYDENGQPVPGSYHAVDPNPQRLKDAILAPINGMYGLQDFLRIYQHLQQRRPVRRH